MNAACRDYFDRRAPGYLAASRRGLWGLVRAAEWRALRDLLALAPGLDVLDAGCGAGHYSLRMSEVRGLRIGGIDVSPAMLAAYRSLGFSAENACVSEFRTGRRYDRVLLAGVLEFAPEPERALANLAGLLKPGGRIVALVPRGGAVGWAYRAAHERRGCPTYAREPALYLETARRLGLTAGPCAAAGPLSAAFALDRR